MSSERDAPNPFVGPRPFRRSEAIYGRDWERQRLIDLLIASRIVLVHAPSGAGKTSLLRAGLAPECVRAGLGRAHFVRVGIEPAVPVENRYRWSATLSLQARHHRVRLEVPATLAEHFDAWIDGRLDRVRGRLTNTTGTSKANGRMGSEVPRVLVFDQFEEILTRDPTDIPAKEVFFEEVARLLHNPRWWAVFAIRDDYLGAIEPFARQLPTRLQERFRLDFLGEQSARDAMRKPVTSPPVRFSAKAAVALVNDLRRVRVQQLDTITLQPGPFVEPVHLQVVCRRLFDQRQRRDRIDEADVKALAGGGTGGTRVESGVDLALAAYFREVVQRAVAVSGLRERRLRDWVEHVLISPRGLRRPVLKEGKTIEGDLPASALEPLLNAYIAREEARRGATVIELAHDRLVEPIRADNRAWREQSLHSFQRQAAEWDTQGRPDRLLLRGRALREAQRWSLQHDEEVEPIERELVEASIDTNLRRSNLAETGWAVVFAGTLDPELREALGELLAHRHRQATAKDARLYREFSGAAGYQPGESAGEFVARHGASLSAVRPERLPYYILIVGHPLEIPWEVQCELDVAYAVGRVWFDSLEQYAHYARSVVASEARDFAIAARATVFAPRHEHDRATDVTAKLFVEPLVAKLQDNPGTWAIDTRVGARATRRELVPLLGDQAPALLMTVSHLVLSPDPQGPLDGGIVCANWPGAGARIEDAHVFSRDDVPEESQLLGAVLILIANFSAGQSSRPTGAQDAKENAREAFVAPLARRLLSHPDGGVLAVLGHLDMLYTTSFLFEDQYEYPLFEKLIRRVMDGHTVGSATDLLAQRYSRLSTAFDEGLRQAFLRGETVDERRFGMLKTAMIDARNYVVLGDPAVRLRAALPGSTAHQRRIVPGTIADGRRALAAIDQPIAADHAADDTSGVGNGVWFASGRHSLPRVTIDELGALLGGTNAAAFATRERQRLNQEYQRARERRRSSE